MSKKQQKLIQEKLDTWEEHLRAIREATQGGRPISESANQKEQRIKRLMNNGGEFVRYYLPQYASLPSPDFHLEMFREVTTNDRAKFIAEWFRGGAKSVLGTLVIPLALIPDRRIRCVLLVSATYENACVLLGDIQAQLMANQKFIQDFGEQYNHGDWTKGRFTTANGVAFFALGMGQSPRGLRNGPDRPDFILLDDVDTDQVVRNPKRIDAGVNWIHRALLPAMSPSAESGKRVVVLNNRIAPDGILPRMVEKHPDWTYSRVPVFDEDGRPAWPELNTPEGWEEIRAIDEAAWQTEYMLNPVVEGRQFSTEWIMWQTRKPEEMEQVVAYIDPSFRDKGDSKAVKVWGKSGRQFHCFDALVRQTSMATVARWCYDLEERWKEDHPEVPIQWWIEGGFIQSDHLDYFQKEGDNRGWQLRIRSENRKKPIKESRIASMIPMYENNYVTYEETQRKDKDMQRGIGQLLAWDYGPGGFDDSPDADEGAWYILDSFRRPKPGDFVVIKRSPSRHRT